MFELLVQRRFASGHPVLLGPRRCLHLQVTNALFIYEVEAVRFVNRLALNWPDFAIECNQVGHKLSFSHPASIVNALLCHHQVILVFKYVVVEIALLLRSLWPEKGIFHAE